MVKKSRPDPEVTPGVVYTTELQGYVVNEEGQLVLFYELPQQNPGDIEPGSRVTGSLTYHHLGKQ